jgi:hypothetical protein
VSKKLKSGFYQNKKKKPQASKLAAFFCFGGQTGRCTGEIKEANICSFLDGRCWGDTRKFVCVERGAVAPVVNRLRAPFATARAAHGNTG